METKEKLDLRTRRTLKKIDTHFKRLMHLVGFENISVVMLMNHTRYSRTTFYSYYTDMIDLYNRHVKEFVNHFVFLLDEELIFSIDGEVSDEYRKTMNNNLAKGLNHIREESDFVKSLIEANNHQLFQQSILHILEESYPTELNPVIAHKEKLKHPMSLVLNFTVNIIVSTIYWWLSNENSVDEMTLAETLSELILHLPFEL